VVTIETIKMIGKKNDCWNEKSDFLFLFQIIFVLILDFHNKVNEISLVLLCHCKDYNKCFCSCHLFPDNQSFSEFCVFTRISSHHHNLVRLTKQLSMSFLMIWFLFLLI
jgi:hypothetical protein